MSWTHVRDTFPTARKTYRCAVCWEAIPVGEQHRARFGYGDNGPKTSRMHEDCCQYADDAPDFWESEPLPGSVTRAEVKEYMAQEERRLAREMEKLPR